MQIIKKTVNDLKLGTFKLFPAHTFRFTPIVVQHNSKHSYMYINPNSVGNALFWVFFSDSYNNFIHVRGGSMIPIPLDTDIRVCFSLANYQRFYREGTAIEEDQTNNSKAGSGQLAYDGNIFVEFILLTQQEAASTQFGGGIKEGDILYSTRYYGNVSAVSTDYYQLLSSEIMTALSWKGVSARIRMSGGWIEDHNEPAWLYIDNAYNDVPNGNGIGVDAFPFPGIGEAYIQMPLVGFSSKRADGAEDVISMAYHSASIAPFDNTKGYVQLELELIAGHLDRKFSYWCNRNLFPSGANEHQPFHFRQIGQNTTPTAFNVYNRSAVGTWRVRELQWMIGLENNVEMGTLPFLDTAIASYSTADLQVPRAHYVTLDGYFTAIPTAPDVFFTCHPQPVG